ncbi:MAG: hypothetical protein ABFS38_04575 [Bacteroidota bacterium]
MSNTLSNRYYLKALEAYPYDLTDAMESLDYALSYDSEHAGAHCLMGQLNMEQLKLYDKAEYHYDQALICDVTYTVTYEYYSLLLIYKKEYDKALKLIKYAYKIPAINRAIMKHREAIISEYLNRLEDAKKLMKEAYNNSCNEEERCFIKLELERIKDKSGSSEKKKSKKKSKKK